METNTDYECYLLGCEVKGFEHLSEWRFRVIYNAFQSGRLGKFGDVFVLAPEKQARFRKRRDRGAQIFVLVTRGKVFMKGSKDSAAAD
jgi:hypothetical protein